MADLFDNPMGLMGFEFVEFASPTPNVLEPVLRMLGFTEVARHRRCLAKHQTLLHPDHARVLRVMRAEQIVAAAFADAVEERDLADYDRRFGVA